MHERKISLRKRAGLLALVAAGLAGVVACTLNPQPLPPDDEERVGANPSTPGGGTTFADAGSPPPWPRDAGFPTSDAAQPPPRDSGPDATPVDAGGDASDASTTDAADGG